MNLRTERDRRKGDLESLVSFVLDTELCRPSTIAAVMGHHLGFTLGESYLVGCRKIGTAYMNGIDAQRI